MVYGKIRVGNPKEQDPFNLPYSFFHIYDKTNDLSVNSKCMKGESE
jgi:hypothetical protein